MKANFFTKFLANNYFRLCSHLHILCHNYAVCAFIKIESLSKLFESYLLFPYFPSLQHASVCHLHFFFIAQFAVEICKQVIQLVKRI